MKLWGGRFKKETDKLAEEYNASIVFDHQLADFDVQGSLAHVKMLEKCEILDTESVKLIMDGLHHVLSDLKKSSHHFDISDEDIHMHIEKQLHHLIGDVAGKLHTGRSRNDQVALDMHLYLRHHILHFVEHLLKFNEVILRLSEENVEIIMPGYTHLQRAEPVRFSHHMLAYFNMFNRDIERLIQSFSNVNICPLGAGALAGSGFDVDRDYVAELLNFDAIYENSLDAVSNRDYIAENLFNASLIMMHFSKMSEEIILWCSKEFSFIQLDDQFCTGSSMMPQKKNPDVAELARGKTGRVYGALMGLLTVLKGLPLAYNKDLQEDKEGLFDTVKTLSTTIPLYMGMLKSMTLNKNNMKQAAVNDYSNATQLANYLVDKGLNFREAHHNTGNIVLHCIEQNILLSELSLAGYKDFSPLVEEDIFVTIQIEQVVEAHLAKGGTAKKSVLEQIESAKKKMLTVSQWLKVKSKVLDINL